MYRRVWEKMVLVEFDAEGNYSRHVFVADTSNFHAGHKRRDIHGSDVDNICITMNESRHHAEEGLRVLKFIPVSP